MQRGRKSVLTKILKIGNFHNSDFHLRDGSGCMLAASGAHPKVAQQMMRNSTVDLTLSRYSHVYQGQTTEAIAGDGTRTHTAGLEGRGSTVELRPQ